MKSMTIIAGLFFTLPNAVLACEDLKTTEAIVDYVCAYSLVSDTQCKIWQEDMRQMNYNNEIIVNSFLSWNKALEEKQDSVAKQ